MRFSSFAFVSSVVALLVLPSPAGAQPADERDWRKIATARDRDRIERWEELFSLAQSRVAQMGGKDTFGNTTLPFSSISLGRPVNDIPEHWTGMKRCRSIDANARTVATYDWFSCRMVKADGGWQIEKATGSVRFKARFFRDQTLGTTALGGSSTFSRTYTGYLSNTDSDWNLAAVLRYDGTRVLRMFMPHELRYEVVEIEVSR